MSLPLFIVYDGVGHSVDVRAGGTAADLLSPLRDAVGVTELQPAIALAFGGRIILRTDLSGRVVADVGYLADAGVGAEVTLHASVRHEETARGTWEFDNGHLKYVLSPLDDGTLLYQQRSSWSDAGIITGVLHPDRADCPPLPDGVEGAEFAAAAEAAARTCTNGHPLALEQ
eukprot:gene3395-6395_t